GVTVYTHRYTKGYPTDIDLIVSDAGYGANDYIKTEKPLVIVTGPGPGSGKLATCLSQLYHEHLRGKESGYSKFETFPIWNLPLKHPVNIAYESATADIRDFNMIDSFHLETYGETSVNYNRDVEVFPVLRRILEKITDKASIYQSPTDMGVNRVVFGIVDDDVVREAAKQESIRRYFRYSCEYAMGLTDKETIQRAELIMEEMGVSQEDRKVVGPARQSAVEAEESGKGNKGIFCGAAIELNDGRIITGKNSPMMHAVSSLVLNVIKDLSKIPDNIHLLSPITIESVSKFKKDVFNQKTVSLNLEEALISLAINATTNSAAQLALEKLNELRGCELHMTHIPTSGDEAGLRHLGVNLTSDSNFSMHGLYENCKGR
ncbi:MAG: DUF1846 family protein, partial [Candidatus Omnitrophica bacterium]|nr:DUF1846 family protein [Candidatus Omnitrophota bacterium]